MKQDSLSFDQYMELAEAGFSGWDFSFLEQTGRMASGTLSWNYYNVVLPYIRNKESLLDMGTGGGEFLRLLQPLPKQTYATEGYAPNVPVAESALAPLGVKVVAVEKDESIPLPDNHFELIINRHESYVPSEVWRMLKPGGLFITQQCGGQNDIELNHWLQANAPEYVHWNVEYAAGELKQQGFELLECKAEATNTRFYDIGAILYYLNIIEWQIEDYAFEKYREQIVKLHERINAEGYVDTTCDRFLILARKPE